MMKLIRMPRPGTFGEAPEELARKAGICAKVLAEARKLAQMGQRDTLPNQLVARAVELLDDMDEILVALEPARNGPSFGLAATLHRELEHLQAANANLRHGRAVQR